MSSLRRPLEGEAATGNAGAEHGQGQAHRCLVATIWSAHEAATDRDVKEHRQAHAQYYPAGQCRVVICLARCSTQAAQLPHLQTHTNQKHRQRRCLVLQMTCPSECVDTQRADQLVTKIIKLNFILINK